MNKKLIVCILALGVVLGGCKIYEGQTAQKIGNKIVLKEKDQDKIEKKLRDQFNLGEEYKFISADYASNDYMGEFEFKFEDDNEIISIQYDRNVDKAVGMNRDRRNEGNVIRFTREGLKAKVEKILNERFSDIKGNLKEVEGEYSTQGNYYDSKNDYTYRYVRTIDGEVYPNNALTINVSGVTGELSSYRMNWDDVKYSKKSSISDKEAEKIFQKESGINAEYKAINISEDYENRDLRLMPVYVVKSNNSGVLDANTKKFLGNEDGINSGRFFEDERNINIYHRQSTQVENGKTKVSKDEAVKKVKELAQKMKVELKRDEIKTVLKKDELENVLYWEVAINYEGGVFIGEVNGESGKIIGTSAQLGYDMNYSMIDQLKEEYSRGYIDKESFDMRAKEMLKYGEITQAEYDSRFQKDESQIEKSELEGELKNYFKAINGEAAELTVQKQEHERQVIVTGFRKENGITFYENGISLTYDSEMKKVTSVEFVWNGGLDFVKPEKQISKEEAINKIFNEVGMERKLVSKFNIKTGEESKDLILVYELGHEEFRYLSIDGKKMYTENGIYVKPEQISGIKDISNSEYKEKIKMLNKMIFLGTEDLKFNPESKVTKSDVIGWIVRSLRGDKYTSGIFRGNYYSGNNSGFEDVKRRDEDFYNVISAVNMDIIEEGGKFNGNNEVTMEEMMKWVINGMGEKKMAQSKELFDGDGYEKLGKFYGLIDDNTDMKETLTKEKAAGIVYDFLVKVEENKK